MWRFWIVSLVLASSALAQEEGTAYEALRVVGTELHRSYLDRIVSVSGGNGDPQPRTWRVLIADRNAAGGLREVDVADGRIVAQRTPMQGTAGSTIKTAQLNLDSSGAYSVASYTAEKSHVNFAIVNYLLRTNERGIPVWIVTLQDERRQPVGTIHIAATKGNVTRVEGMFRGTNAPPVAQEGQPGGGRETVSVGD